MYDGTAFALTRHLRRLRRSALGIGLAEPDEDAVRDGRRGGARGRRPDVGRLRITLHRRARSARLAPVRARGAAPDASLVLAGPASAVGRLARRARAVGAQRAVVGRRAQDDVVRGERRRASPRRTGRAPTRRCSPTRSASCARAPASNVFVERDGELVTPPLSSGCLAGITRELLLEWAAQAGLPVREAAPGELRVRGARRGRRRDGAPDDERLDPQRLAGGQPRRVPTSTAGPVSLEAQRLFQARLADDLDP